MATTTRTRRTSTAVKPTATRTASRAKRQTVQADTLADTVVADTLAALAVAASPVVQADTLADTLAANAARALEAAKIDAEATGRDLVDVLADMGLNPDGTIKPLATKYDGPMLILREAAQHYVIAPNGQPNCGDDLAKICGTYEPRVVIRALIDAMKLESNPYHHLNIGQQSMNLRNKARNMLKKDEIGMGQIRAAFQRVQA